MLIFARGVVYPYLSSSLGYLEGKGLASSRALSDTSLVTDTSDNTFQPFSIRSVYLEGKSLASSRALSDTSFLSDNTFRPLFNTICVPGREGFNEFKKLCLTHLSHPTIHVYHYSMGFVYLEWEG